MHEDRVGVSLAGTYEQLVAGGDTGDELRDFAAPFDLQAVGTEVSAAVGLQKAVEVANELG
jgi:hypothetical protein